MNVVSAASVARAVRRTAERLYSGRDVMRVIDRMAAELAPRLTDADPVVLAVMHGGAFTALELSRRLGFPHQFDYVHVSRYRGETRGADLHWLVRPSSALAGRTVLVVDDILDRGHTLRALTAELDRVGVAKQLSAVLVRKRFAREPRRPAVDAVGVEVDDRYVFGCGMDYRGYWRELRGIYALPKDAV